MLNTELLTRVAEWLEAGAPHDTARGMRFDMGPIVSLSLTQDATNTNWCGTACCIAGAAITFGDPSIVLVKLAEEQGRNSWYLTPRHSTSLILWDDAVHLLDLNVHEASLLFAPHEMEMDDYNDNTDAAKDVAELFPNNDWSGLDFELWPYNSEVINAAWAARTIRDFLTTRSIRWDRTHEDYVAPVT